MLKTLLVSECPLILSSEMPGPSSANCVPSGVNAGYVDSTRTVRSRTRQCGSRARPFASTSTTR